MSVIYTVPDAQHVVLDSATAFGRGTEPYVPRPEDFAVWIPHDKARTPENGRAQKSLKRKRKRDLSEAQISYREHQETVFEQERELRDRIRTVLRLIAETKEEVFSGKSGNEKNEREGERKVGGRNERAGIDFVAFAGLAEIVRQGFRSKNGAGRGNVDDNEEGEEDREAWDRRIELTDSVSCLPLELSDVYGTLVRNDSDVLKRIVFDLQDGSGANRTHEYLVPPRSSFVMSNMADMQPLVSEARRIHGFDLIVLDPPWTNSSATRSGTYATQPNDHSFYRLPLPALISADALVAVWITNRSRLSRFVATKLFKAWDLEVVGTWHWIKVTKGGETVLDLEDKRRRTWEPIVIGRRKRKTKGPSEEAGRKEEELSGATTTSASSVVVLPESRFLFGVPSTVHSRKPPLFDSFKPYLPTDRPPKCLELFARCLTPGWTSWGNEPLKFQSVEYFNCS